VSPEATVYEALELMADKEIGAVLVLAGQRPVGIFTERDHARKLVLHDRLPRTTPVSEVMVANPVCIRPDQSIEECMALMTSKRFRHLPVVEEDLLVGMISIGDVVKAVIDGQKFIIEQLENYISS
jgi:CBS domain-containing protein